jgi:sec-independent protein translocase protein TatC
MVMRMLGRTGGTQGEMPFLEHLEELRWRILYTIIALFVGTAIGFAVVHYLGVMELLIRPVRPHLQGGQLAFFSPVTPFFVTLKLSLVVGLILAFPVVVYQAWAFLSPGLTAEEKKVIVPSLYFGLVLFCAGVAMAYFFVLPLALIFLTGFQQEFLQPMLEVGQYLAFVTKLLVAFGVAFELPVVIMILSALGLVTPRFLRDKRRHAIVGITVLASLLTPGDLASTVLMIIPMMILYEGSIFLSVMIYRKREESLSDEPLRPSEEAPSGAVEADPWGHGA